MMAKICENEYKYFLNKPNVIGLAFGYKFVKGYYISEKCITVFVRKKVTRNKLLSTEIIPELYKGIKTDIKECGTFVCNSLTGRVRPDINGYSIGNILTTKFGSSGCLVADRYLYILGNNHVFALNNTASIESAIVQPAVGDGGRIEKDVIGHLNRFVPIQFIEDSSEPSNFVDCALCKVISKSFVSPNIAYIGIPKGTSKGKVGENVKKVGRTSELTYGQITHLHGTFSVQCGYVSKNALFKNQIVTDKMCIPGDSGALLLNDDNYAVGLCMGSSKTCSLFNEIENVLKSLKVKLVTN